MATSKKKSSSDTTSAFDFPDLGKLLEQFKLPGVDVSALAEWQRKDLEALVEANEKAYEGIKALAERRGEMLVDALTQWQDALKGAVEQESLSDQSERLQQGVQQAIENFRELTVMEAQVRIETWKVAQARLEENMASLQKLLQSK